MADAPRLRRGGRKLMSVQARPPVPKSKNQVNWPIAQWQSRRLIIARQRFESSWANHSLDAPANAGALIFTEQLR